MVISYDYTLLPLSADQKKSRLNGSDNHRKVDLPMVDRVFGKTDNVGERNALSVALEK